MKKRVRWFSVAGWSLALLGGCSLFGIWLAQSPSLPVQPEVVSLPPPAHRPSESCDMAQAIAASTSDEAPPEAAAPTRAKIEAHRSQIEALRHASACDSLTVSADSAGMTAWDTFLWVGLEAEHQTQQGRHDEALAIHLDMIALAEGLMRGSGIDHVFGQIITSKTVSELVTLAPSLSAEGRDELGRVLLVLHRAPRLDVALDRATLLLSMEQMRPRAGASDRIAEWLHHYDPVPVAHLMALQREAERTGTSPEWTARRNALVRRFPHATTHTTLIGAMARSTEQRNAQLDELQRLVR